MHCKFDQRHLTDIGFVGFGLLRRLPRGCFQIPSRAGVYAVILDPPTTAFLTRSVGGHFKGKDPTVSMQTLSEKWLDGVPTLYFGRASDLRKRIDLLARYGRGEPVGHQGGRYLWQIAEHDRLRVGWRPDGDPVRAERQLLDEFEESLRRLPFANLIRGARPLELV